ncbi:MAG: hypothetical protein AB8G16_00385 [Gammaproteobacteria bacterium]
MIVKTLAAAAVSLACVAAMAWEQVPNTRLDQINPCPGDRCDYSGNLGFKAVVEAWNGAALDQKESRLYVYGGGHTDYWGNEVYELDLVAWNWTRLSEPSPPGDDFFDEAAERSGRMPDGSPRVPHTYDSLVFDPEQRALLAIGAVGTSPNSIAGHRHVERFDVASTRWREPLAAADVSGYFLGGTALDPKTGLVWIHTSGAGQLASFDPVINRWTNYIRSARFKNFSLSAGGNELLMLGGCGRRRCNHWLHDLTRPDSDPRDLSGLADIARSEGPGLTYNSKLGKFAAYVDGVLYHIDTAGSGSYEAVAKGPASTLRGVFGRFAYVPAKNAYVYVAATDQDVWVRYLDKDYGDAGKVELPAPTGKGDRLQARTPEQKKPRSERKKERKTRREPKPKKAASVAAGLQEWAQRSAGEGVQFAYRFDRADDVLDHVLPNNPNWTNGAEYVSADAQGMRMDMLNTSTRQHGNWHHCLLRRCRGLNVGETVYVAHSQYFDEPMITEIYRRANSTGRTGFKQTIISRFDKSAPNGEVVLTNIGQRGYPQAYRKHRGKTAEQFGGMVHQPAVRGGPHYNDKISLGKIPRRFKGVAYPKNGWLHFKQVIYMASASRAYYSLYAARPGEAWTLLVEDGDVDLYNNFQYNGVWLLPYTSNGAADPERSNTYTVYKDLIISLQDIAAPAPR